MSKKENRHLDDPELSTRELKRRFVPLVVQFMEEIEVKTKDVTVTKRFPFRYDVRNDMLHLFITSSEDTVSTPGFEGVYIDYHPETKRIVGMTFLAFQKRFLQKPEVANDVRMAWAKNRWKFKIISYLESFAGLFGISLEEIENRQAQRAVESWVDWHKENPGELELIGVTA
jgi:hypothetical protein